MVDTIETERKFLVDLNTFQEYCKDKVIGTSIIEQCYPCIDTNFEVRLRKKSSGPNTITFKSPESQLTRLEFEFETGKGGKNAEIFHKLFDHEKNNRVIKKLRHKLQGSDWVVDIFTERHLGLCIAEIETSEIQSFPEFIGLEVTGNEKFYNAKLASMTEEEIKQLLYDCKSIFNHHQ